MGKLEESGMSIGDYAMSLIDSGQVAKKGTISEVARPASMPTTDVDISDVAIPGSMVEQVLQESFGMSNEAPKRETVREPLLSEQELLQEKITSLRSELVETVNKLTSLVSEAAQMVENFSGVMSMGPPPGATTNVTGKYRGRNRRTKKIKRTSN